MYVFSPGALGALDRLDRFYLALADLSLPTHVCICPGALGALGSLGRLYLAVAELLLPTHLCI